MPRWLKIILRIIGGIFLLIVLGGVVITFYINSHKKELMQKLTKQLNEDIIGTLTIEDISPELIRGFPAISVSLKNVLLRDSLYPSHHHDLLKADNVYVSIDAFSLLKTPHIRSLEASNGSIYIFTDSTGYSNTHIFRKKDTSSSKKSKPKVNHLYLSSIQFTFENRTKFKLFQLDVHNMETILDYNLNGWKASINLSALVQSFAFNTAKGSYMKDKELSLDGNVEYDKEQEKLIIPMQPVRIGTDDLRLGGSFSFMNTPGSFVLNIAAEDILFKNAKALLSPNISSKLATIDLKKPVNVTAYINGRMKFRDTPVVNITMTVKNNTLVTPGGDITNCSFNGSFLNTVNPAHGYTEDNALISMYALKGSWENIPFNADTVFVKNLLRPVVQGRFRSRFPLERLNPIIGSNTFIIKTGTADVDLLYKGGILADDTSTSFVYGTVQVGGAAMTYLPRRMTFTNTSALVRFSGSDVLIEKAKVQCGSTILTMNGGMRNFMHLYYKSPDKLLLDWSIHSDYINLREFLTFLSARQAGAATAPAPQSGNKTLTHISQQLDNVLAASSVHMTLKVEKLKHRNFTADDIDADILMQQKEIVLNKVNVSNAGGRLSLQGNISQSASVNNFHVAADIINVRIPEFFKSFDNFGQDAITDKNLMGRLYAKVDVTGSIQDTGSIVPRSFDGRVDFEVKDGALINFGPFLKVSKYVFRNRELGNVRFTSLKNTLNIKGEKITIPPMMIESSAINLKVGGVYSLTTGTDIDIDIPLRNPKDDELIIDDSLKEERNMKGIVIHLNAIDGDDGSVKIKLRMKKKEKTSADSNAAETTEDAATPKKKSRLRRLLGK